MEIKQNRQKGFDESRKLDDDDEKQKKKRVHSDFKKIMMQSEWLVDVPENIDDWYVAICPVGRRRMLNAQYGKTCLYNNTGFETKT